MPGYGRPAYDAVQLLLDRETSGLDARLEARVRRMVDRGLLHEVRRLEREGLRTGVTASRALGYAQFLAVLDGTASIEQAIGATAAATRRFVRRQRSWFRRDHRMIGFDAAAPDLVVTKSDGGTTVNAGGSVAYTINYSNAGLANATGVVEPVLDGSAVADHDQLPRLGVLAG